MAERPAQALHGQPTARCPLTLAPEPDDPLHTVLHTLRKPGDEAQLTQIIGAFARADRGFAADVVRALLAHADPERVARLGGVPRELECRPEERLIDAKGEDQGFVDLRFSDPGGTFTLLVELKIRAAYGYRQLDRYMIGLQAMAQAHGGLLAITRDLPSSGEEQVEGMEHWIGSVRWADVYGDLRALRHPDPALRPLWPALLDRVAADGDFGILRVDDDAVYGWGLAERGQATLTGLLDEIADRTLDIVRAALAAHRGVGKTDALADLIKHKSGRLHHAWKGRLVLQIAIPASSGDERIRVQFLRAGDAAYFTVEGRHPAKQAPASIADEWIAATNFLAAKDFSYGRDWETYWSRVHPASDWLEGEGTIQERLLDRVHTAVLELVDSRLLDILPAGGAIASPPAEPDALS